MDFKAPFDKYPEIIGQSVDIEKIRQSIDIILNSSIQHEFRTTLVSSLHSFEDVVEIAKSIKGADLFALQKFRLTSTLNPKFMSCASFDDNVLLDLKKEAEKHVKQCVIR
jgi:pyruvate formate lyase activating enzyme